MGKTLIDIFGLTKVDWNEKRKIYEPAVLWARKLGTRLTEHDTAHAEKRMHGVQSPFDMLLEIRRHFAHDIIERPIRRCR